jgi:hypothetical protein
MAFGCVCSVIGVAVHNVSNDFFEKDLFLNLRGIRKTQSFFILE